MNATEVSPSDIPDLGLPVAKTTRDARGTFTKSWVAQRDPLFALEEVFWSSSRRGVIRGMHLQLEPYSGNRLVWVSEGAIVDVVLDLRSDSPTYLHWCRLQLDATCGAVLVPRGCAHGFEVMSEFAHVQYACDYQHVPSHEAGILWNSFGMEWTTSSPVLSDRDKQLPSLRTASNSIRAYRARPGLDI
jgi:dTDP-4-dehydrorhamnose 3,5-epimerase